MEDGQILVLGGQSPTIRRLVNLGFSVAYHEFHKPESGLSVSFEARHKGQGLRFQGFAKNGARDVALARLAKQAESVLSDAE